MRNWKRKGKGGGGTYTEASSPLDFFPHFEPMIFVFEDFYYRTTFPSLSPARERKEFFILTSAKTTTTITTENLFAF